jgi:hypothetical protein
LLGNWHWLVEKWLVSRLTLLETIVGTEFVAAEYFFFSAWVLFEQILNLIVQLYIIQLYVQCTQSSNFPNERKATVSIINHYILFVLLERQELWRKQIVFLLSRHFMIICILV